MSKKVTDIVAYITPIGLILAFLIGDREKSKFHINQALVIFLAEILLGIVERILGRIPLLGGIIGVICGIIGLILFIFWIIGLVSACQGTEKRVPVIGDIVLYR
jgi:uncharacterized membrane protein